MGHERARLRRSVDRLSITGGVPLRGRVAVSGSKNAALPILCAALLSDGTSTLRNVPALRDIRTLGSLLAQLGAQVSVEPTYFNYK